MGVGHLYWNFHNGPGIFDPREPDFFSRFPLNNFFFRLSLPGNFRDFLGDHFARVESSGDQNLTMFILDCYVFLHF